MEISRFHVRFQDFQKDYARFLARFQWRFCKISRFQWRFLQDFQILIQILTYWFWISRWCDYLLHIRGDWHSVYRQELTFINTCMCDTDTMYKQVIGIYMHACMQIDYRQFQGTVNTVKPPNRGHFGDRPFVPCREAVLFSEVLF